MILNKKYLNECRPEQAAILPAREVLDLPEKVLQFGTGVLLRGLPDYFIDKANRQGLFNGRIVVVKTTTKGGISEFDEQDGLYTICVRGIAGQKKIEQNIVCSAISRVLGAGNDWHEILEFAGSNELQVVISNTTEVGIQYVEEDISNFPPSSFPGKLLALLYKRFQDFKGDPTKGLVILPTELIPDNGARLKEIILKLAAHNSLKEDFIKWLNESNRFCNTLVDRIVPGKPDQNLLVKLNSDLGFDDKLLLVAEAYKLWAIEGDDHVKDKLSFALADPDVIITSDINIYRELKLRLLNGTHTLSCGLALLCGIDTVKEAMDDEKIFQYISGIMLEEISGAIPCEVSPDIIRSFCMNVLDRFRNPHIEHHWQSISMNYSAKLGLRIVPVLKQYYKTFDQVPNGIAFGFAAHILFMKPTVEENGKYYGIINGKKYLIDDIEAPFYFKEWQKKDTGVMISNLLSETRLWNADLTELTGFAESVTNHLSEIMKRGIGEAVEKLDIKKPSVI